VGTGLNGTIAGTVYERNTELADAIKALAYPDGQGAPTAVASPRPEDSLPLFGHEEHKDEVRTGSVAWFGQDLSCGKQVAGAA
jgi:hypothetical protein